MSLSTTTSAAYVLTKYSRSYPPSQSTVRPQPLALEHDWQHFTNPMIHLMLDIRKSGPGELDSYRMRIVWSIHSEPDAMDLDHKEVVFEDIDLLSFSSSFTTHGSRVRQVPTLDTGLPLKAVYRDCVVGFRYLHPRIIPPGHNAVYRRIQVNFKSADDAANFIDAIRQVCPCKENPPPVRGRAMTMANSSQATKHVDMPPPQLLRSSGPHRLESTHLMESSRLPARPPARASTISSSQTINQTSFSSVLNPSSVSISTTNPTIGTTIITSNTFNSSQGPIDLPGGPVQLEDSVQRSDIDPPATMTSTATSQVSNLMLERTLIEDDVRHIPPEITPSVSTSGLLNGLAGASSGNTAINSVNDHAELLESLGEVPALYDLPMADLEKLVAQVIREDGFGKMLEKLDAMWRIKGVLDLT